MSTVAIADAFEAIRRRNGSINAFTAVTDRRPLSRSSGPLRGVPFAVKNLFDVAGLTTLAGSKINRDLPPALQDATAITRLEACGANLVGTLNMDEYASGYTTENSHYGATRNPHDLKRTAGGSSGGSGAAVAAGLVPLALGSDTAGSIRVPASFCGVWGLKPTYGRLSRAGTFPFCASLDTIGPLANSLEVLAQAYDAMQGPDSRDPACAQRPVAPVTSELDRGMEGLRIARVGGYFEAHAEPSVVELVRRAAAAIGTDTMLEIPEEERASAAALVITRAEAGQLHLPNLKRRANDFDPLIRDRLLANTLIPAAWYVHAQRFRRWHYRQVLKLFDSVDILLAPATPTPAHRFEDETVTLGGKLVPTRAAAGFLVAPFSLVGVPVLCAPIGAVRGLPIGLQIIAAPWREDLCFRLARALEAQGIAQFTPAAESGYRREAAAK
jgi:AtzE family amidohydrolase